VTISTGAFVTDSLPPIISLLFQHNSPILLCDPCFLPWKTSKGCFFLGFPVAATGQVAAKKTLLIIMTLQARASRNVRYATSH
jgi:hypothetical protein